jgi:hypothetical protein
MVKSYSNKNMSDIETIIVDDKFIKKIKSIINIALSFEGMTAGKRKLGITGVVGEFLICHHMGLKLMLNPRSEGFDAVDKKGRKVEIKTRRSESEGLPRDVGRISRFSKHKFDYAVLGILDHKYQLCEIWSADYKKLKPIIDNEQNERSGPTIRSFKRIGKIIFNFSAPCTSNNHK